MTAEEDRRRMDGVLAAISALQAGEKHALEDRDLIRKEIRDARRELSADIATVGDECRDFRKEVRDTWKIDRDERAKRKASSKLVVVAIIGASATVLGSMIAAAAAILTGG
jgi:hypothetical protein